MVYSAQMGAVQPMGMKKKRMRYAPMVQEQAKAGLATKLVTQAKQEEQRQEEFDFQKQQHQAQTRQWEQEMKQRQKEFKQKKKADTVSNVLGGISTAVQIADMFF